MKQEDFEAMGEYVKKHIPQWFKEADLIPKEYSANTFLVERVVRVEEMRHDMNSRFNMMYKLMASGFALLAFLVTLFQYI